MDNLERLDKEGLLFFISCYNGYILDFYETHEESMQPVCVYEFFDNDFVECIEQRIEAIEKHLKYCEERDKVCLAIDGDIEVMKLEEELEMLENLLEEVE